MTWLFRFERQVSLLNYLVLFKVYVDLGGQGGHPLLKTPLEISWPSAAKIFFWNSLFLAVEGRKILKFFSKKA